MIDIERHLPSPKTLALQEIKKVFALSLNRAHGLSQLHQFTATFQAIVHVFEKHRDETAKEFLQNQQQLEAKEAEALFTAFTNALNARLDKAIDPEAISKQTQQYIDQMRKNNAQFASWILAQYQSAVVLIWSAFESAVSDTWIATVNQRPDLFAFRVIKTFEERLPQGMSSKSIPLGIAAKYKFNLTNHIGDIVGGRIDFTDLGELRKAFKAICELDEHTIGLLQHAMMRELLLVRNVIAHRGGIIDETFKKCANHSGAIGEQIDISPDMVMNYLAIVTTATGGLLKAADDAVRA